MGRLDGKVVVITGASRGIGAEIARLFAAEGGRVICAARTLREGDHQMAGSLETTVTDIRAAGGEARAVAANIAEPAECERLIGAAREAYGPVDVLVNNAALTYYLPTKDYPLNRWLRSWAVNFHAPFVLSQLVLADMIARRSGAIVNISSGAAIGPGRGPYLDPSVGTRGGTCYGAEKAALERFTQGLASEVYQHGVPAGGSRRRRVSETAFRACGPRPGRRDRGGTSRPTATGPSRPLFVDRSSPVGLLSSHTRAGSPPRERRTEGAWTGKRSWMS